jgi:hypothetical protein
MTNTRIYNVEPGSEIDSLLDAANQAPVELEKNGVRYRVTRIHPPLGAELVDEDDIWSGYDLDRVREGIRRSAGAFHGVDRDQLLADLAEQREQDSRGRPT